MRQYCFARWRLSSSVTLPAGEPAGRPPSARVGDCRRAVRVGGRAADITRQASTVRATPCLIGFNPCWLKAPQRGDLPRNGPHEIFFFLMGFHGLMVNHAYV